MHRQISMLSLLFAAACGGSGTGKAPVTPTPAPVTDQEMCQRVAERVVERFVAAAASRSATDYPDSPSLSPQQALDDEHRAMFVTVVFDSCFAEWSPPARKCLLDATPAAPIESCRPALTETKLAAAIRRTATLLHSLAS